MKKGFYRQKTSIVEYLRHNPRALGCGTLQQAVLYRPWLGSPQPRCRAEEEKSISFSTVQMHLATLELDPETMQTVKVNIGINSVIILN